MSKQRHNRSHPCPVCGGHDAQPRGTGKRCGGFTSEDGYAHCTQVPCGEIEDGGTYAHRLSGSCRCGVPHGSVIIEPSPEPARVVDHIGTWQSLDRRNLVGEQYLWSRRLHPTELHERNAVRYHARYGSPAVALRDLETGEVCGIQYHPGAGKKPITATGSKCSGAALHGRIDELDPGGVDVAVLVEGFADTLTAVLAFPSCSVFGAPGAAQLATIASAVAPRIRAIHGWMLVVPQDDHDGVKAGVAAVRAAHAAGLMLDVDLHLVDLGEHKDLNDAWKAGWRWQWPGERDGVA